MKKNFIAFAVAAAAVGAAQASSIPIKFNPYGTGASAIGDIIPVDVFDWAPGSALALGGNNLPIGGDTFTPPSPSLGGPKAFDLLASATLASLQNGGLSYGTDIVLPRGPFPQISFVLRFPEVGWQTAPGSAQLRFDAVSTNPNFFEIWAGPPATFANPLTGSGFNDGVLLLRGAVVADGTSGSFSASPIPPTGPVNFDQVGADNWAITNGGIGQKTVTGSGGSKVTVSVAGGFGFVNPSYFVSIPTEFEITLFDTQNNLPFNKGNNPSDCFISAPGGIAFSNCNGVFNDLDPGGINTSDFAPPASDIGTVNGAPTGSGGGNSVEFLTDASQSFLAIPEPGTVALLGMGLAGLGFFGSRKRKV